MNNDGPGLTNTGSNGSVGGIAGNVIFGTLTTEGDYYEGQSLDGVGNYCADCKLNGVDANPDNNIQQVTLSNIEEVTCELNGKNTDGTCKTEPWAVGETSLSLNGYGIDGYKIVFYANGGEYADGSDAKNKFFDIGTAINADDIVSPSDEENTFMGWALDRNATAPAENLGTVSKSDTVFAVWQPKLTLTFDVSPGVFPDDNVQVKTKRVDKGGLVTVGGLGSLPTSFQALAPRDSISLRRASSSASVSSTLMVRFGMSISITSPVCTRPMLPLLAASGEAWPMERPLVPPEKRPSVRSAQDLPR